MARSVHGRRLVFTGLIFGSAWTAGIAVRRRERRATQLEDEAADLRQQRDQAATAAAVDERGRIARELHDIIAHSVSVMVLQAGAAGEVLSDNPGSTKACLDSIQQTGRQALVELRRLLGVLGDQDAAESLSPQPSIEHLDTLIQTVRETGLRIDVTVHGSPRRLRPGVDLSAFRIIQEALTNAARHAGPVAVTLILGYDDQALDIQVLDTGTHPTRGLREGRGLVGMRERVALHAGRLDVGPRPAGGFAVHARLPLQPAQT